MDPMSLLMIGVIAGCSHHIFGPDCDEDAKCWNWANMVECHERYFGDIHTKAYRESIRVGHNPKPRIPFVLPVEGKEVKFTLSFEDNK